MHTLTSQKTPRRPPSIVIPPRTERSCIAEPAEYYANEARAAENDACLLAALRVLGVVDCWGLVRVYAGWVRSGSGEQGSNCCVLPQRVWDGVGRATLKLDCDATRDAFWRDGWEFRVMLKELVSKRERVGSGVAPPHTAPWRSPRRS